jgi:putative membrane protein
MDDAVPGILAIAFHPEEVSMFPRIKPGPVAAGFLVALAWGALHAGAPTVGVPPMEPREFVAAAVQAGMMEVEAAKLAMNASKTDAVKTFADRMLTDHQMANQELATIAMKKRIPVPMELDPEHAKALKALHAKSAKEFDDAYAAQMVEDHQQVIKLFEPNVANPDGELAAYVAKTLPVLKQHQQLSDNLRANLKASRKK